MSAMQIVMVGMVVLAVVGPLAMAWTKRRDRLRGETWDKHRDFFGGGSGCGGGGCGGGGD